MDPPRRRKRRFDVTADDVPAAAPAQPPLPGVPPPRPAVDNVHPSRLPAGGYPPQAHATMPALDAQQQRDMDDLLGVVASKGAGAAVKKRRLDDAPMPAHPPLPPQPPPQTAGGSWTSTPVDDTAARPAFMAQHPASAPAQHRDAAGGAAAPAFRPRRIDTAHLPDAAPVAAVPDTAMPPAGAADEPTADAAPAPEPPSYTEEQLKALEPENVAAWDAYVAELREYMVHYAAYQAAELAKRSQADAYARQLTRGAMATASKMIAADLRKAELQRRAARE